MTRARWAAMALVLTGAAPVPGPPTLVPLTVTAWPKTADIAVREATGLTLHGHSPFTVELLPGPTEVTVTAPGLRTEARTVSLSEEAARLEFCLDPPDQLLDCVRVLHTAHGPKAVTLDDLGEVATVSALYGPTAVEFFDLRTGASLGGPADKEGAVELEPSADGGTVLATQLNTGLVLEVDRTTHQVLRRFSSRGILPKVARRSADGARLFTANWLSDDVSELDLATGKLVRRLPTVQTPRGLYAQRDGGALYVAGFGKGELARVDLETGASKVVFSGGRALRHLVADPSEQTLYVSDMGRARVWKYDFASGQTSAFADTDPTPNTIALSPDGALLFVSTRGVNSSESYLVEGPTWGSVQVFDTADGHLVDAVVGGNQCTGLAVSGDGKVLAFTDFLDDALRIYAVPTTEALRAGGGGRGATYRAELVKHRQPRSAKR